MQYFATLLPVGPMIHLALHMPCISYGLMPRISSYMPCFLYCLVFLTFFCVLRMNSLCFGRYIYTGFRLEISCLRIKHLLKCVVYRRVLVLSLSGNPSSPVFTAVNFVDFFFHYLFIFFLHTYPHNNLSCIVIIFT